MLERLALMEETYSILYLIAHSISNSDSVIGWNEQFQKLFQQMINDIDNIYHGKKVLLISDNYATISGIRSGSGNWLRIYMDDFETSLYIEACKKIYE